MTISFAQQTRMRKFHVFYANTNQHKPYGIQKDLNFVAPRAHERFSNTVPRHTCAYHKEEINRTLSYIYIEIDTIYESS